jgi:hypothetical protein
MMKSRTRELQSRGSFVLRSVLAALLVLGAGAATGAEKITIGAVEEVVLLPWGVTLLARIDTGAATSSLDAREVSVRGTMVKFRLPPLSGGLELTVPLVDLRYIRTAEGGERRPVVEMDVCLGTRLVRTQVTLNDRTRQSYPFLVGRRMLKDNFVVDVSHFERIPANCPKAQP